MQEAMIVSAEITTSHIKQQKKELNLDFLYTGSKVNLCENHYLQLF